MAKKKMGRGLDALMAGRGAAAKAAETPAADKDTGSASSESTGKELPVEMLQRGEYQPRRDMQPEALEELASSIRSQGVMQPIVVRPVSGDKYEIIAGERRWRASQLAGLDKVPVIIRHVADESAFAMALIENLQREDLNPMEEAQALARLQQEFDLTHDQIADLIGKSRSAVSNLVRLTRLREDVQRLLEHGDLEMGHARALLSLDESKQGAAAQEIVARGLSVRQTEALVKRLQQEQQKQPPEKLDPDIQRLQDELSGRLGAPVRIQHSAKGKGKLVLSYSSLAELDGILNKIR